MEERKGILWCVCVMGCVGQWLLLCSSSSSVVVVGV